MTDAKQQAAKLVANKSKISAEQIAAAVGVSRRTIQAWKKEPEFLAAVKAERAAWRPIAHYKGISDIDWTLRHLKDRHKRCVAVIVQRAKDPQFKGVPGGDTGLLTVTYKMQSQGEGLGSAKVAEYAVDTALLQEMREIEVQVQTHLGTWKAKVDISGSVDVNVLMDKINAGRKRVADEKIARDEAAKAKVL